MTNSATGRRLGLKARRAEEWTRICVAFGYRCAYCGEKPAMLYRDHAFPKVRGGDDEIENILPACGGCKKGRADAARIPALAARAAHRSAEEEGKEVAGES